MKLTIALCSVAILAAAATSAPAATAPAPTDAQIAHIVYTADTIDIVAAKQALVRSRDAGVRSFAAEMIRDHGAVNAKALALLKRLGVTPQPNATSSALQTEADGELRTLSRLTGSSFDRAYLRNEVSYHNTVNGALRSLLIPSATNAELKSLLQAGLAIFEEHQAHAEQIAGEHQ